jgi:hypothetical protein
MLLEAVGPADQHRAVLALRIAFGCVAGTAVAALLGVSLFGELCCSSLASMAAVVAFRRTNTAKALVLAIAVSGCTSEVTPLSPPPPAMRTCCVVVSYGAHLAVPGYTWVRVVC